MCVTSQTSFGPCPPKSGSLFPKYFNGIPSNFVVCMNVKIHVHLEEAGKAKTLKMTSTANKKRIRKVSP